MHRLPQCHLGNPQVECPNIHPMNLYDTPIVTSSICGYDYTICITQSQIHLFNQHKELQRVPQSFYRRVKTKTCANPYA